MFKPKEEIVPITLPAPRLVLVDRQPQITIRVEDRLSRGEVVNIQQALPKDVYERLKQETQGSMAQAINALLRYALWKLDEDGKSLIVRRRE